MRYSEEQLFTALRNAHSAGDTSAAKRFAQLIDSGRQIKAESKQTYDPTEGMSGWEKFAAGAGKSVYDTGRGLGNLVGLVSDDELRGASQRDSSLMDTGAGLVGNIAGHAIQFALPGGAVAGAGKMANAVNTARTLSAGKGLAIAPVAASKAASTSQLGNTLINAGKSMMAPTTATGAATGGGLYGFAQGGEDGSLSTRLGGGLMSAAGGAAGQKASQLIGAALMPKVRPEAKTLLNQGDNLTTGDILGGATKDLEERLMSVPILGRGIANARTRNLEGYNRNIWNKVLSPIGKTLPKEVQVGNEAFDHVVTTIGKAYDDILPKMKLIKDDAFDSKMLQLDKMLNEVPSTLADPVRAIIKNKVTDKFTQFGRMSGENMKQAISEIGTEASILSRSTDYGQRKAGQALWQVRANLHELMKRSNPKYASKLRLIDKSYSLLTAPEQATGMVGNSGGAFTPAQLFSSLKATDKSSFNKRAFKKGAQEFHDVAKAGKDAMSVKTPSSGSIERLMAAGSLMNPKMLGYAALGLPMYTQTGQKLTQALLTKRPQILQGPSQLLRGASPYTGLLGLQAGYSESRQ